MIQSVVTEESTRNTEFKVCILAAGSGTRMGAYGKSFNKCLLPWRGKALLSHLIEKYPPNTEFVIALGYFADQVRDYASLAHPEARIKFVNVFPFEGPGSGPGRSLLACRPFLPGPFYFVACDTLWEGAPPPPALDSWAGTASVDRAVATHYCHLELNGEKVISVIDKKDPGSVKAEAFVGLAYFSGAIDFWESLATDADSSGEPQIAPALSYLAQKGMLHARAVQWRDFGTAALYARALAESGDFDFSKSNESIYFAGGKVIKFFADQSITEKRCLRANQNPGVFPNILARAGGFYSYNWAPGNTLYEKFDQPTFNRFLQWLPRRLWLEKKVPESRLRKACDNFYREKSLARIRDSLRICADLERIQNINDEAVPPLRDLLEKIPWESVIGGAAPSFIHGDLQPDNVLVTGNGFLLLDWRQDFGGEVDFGDIYYDFSKLNGGLELLYAQIKKSDFSFRAEGNEITYRLPTHPNQALLQETLRAFLLDLGHSLPRMELLTALIYCNMAPLHQPPFRELLYALGRKRLHQEIQKRRQA